MPSPFPGMDPYLEGYLWPDVHQRLASEISDQLNPRLRPNYVARLAVTIVKDETPEVEIGIMYPDVEVLTTGRDERPSGAAVTQAPTITQPLTVPIPDFQVRLVTVEIHDVARNQLITSIEILSSVNKREPGLSDYRSKQNQLQQNGVHLLEIDLLRRGKRLLASPFIPKSPYLITLTRAGKNRAEVWPVHLEDRLPVVAVPLREADADVPLNLSAALRSIYEKGAYDLSIDYNQSPPPPDFKKQEKVWLQNVLRERVGSAGDQRMA